MVFARKTATLGLVEVTSGDTGGLKTVPQTVPRTARRKPRKNPHRGVLLLPPQGTKNPNWRARFKDPETGRTRVQTLTAAEAKTAETRLEFALRAHKAIHRRRDDIGDGATPHRTADLSVADAFDRYFATWGAHKAPKTVRTYRDACDAFVAWAGRTSLRTVRQLSKGRLRDFAASRVVVEKRSPRKGGKRGEFEAAIKRRSPHSVNRELRAVATVLNTLRKMEVVRLTRDDIADGLERVSAPVERRDFLRPEQLRQLLAACKAHDAATFDLTRDGSKDTPRFKPVTPAVLFMLMTGTRAGEAIAVTWSDVTAGEIHVRAEVSKTGHARTIDTAISPALEALLADGGSGRVLDFTEDELKAARRRLVATYGAPAFTWHTLRRTCGTFLTCAPSIFGAASAYRSARQLGHSVTIAEKHYTGVVKVSPDAKTLEAAMGLEALA